MKKQDKTTEHQPLPIISKALEMAAELIRRPEMLEYFLSTSIEQDGISIMKDFNSVQNPAWVQGMAQAFHNKDFVDLIDQIIANSHITLNVSHITINDENGDTLPDSDPMMVAIHSTADCIKTNHQDPRWITLILFCLSRMIGTTTQSLFENRQWSDFTIAAYGLEKTLLLGDGKTFANDLLNFNERSSAPMPLIISERISQGFAEAALSDGYKLSFFDNKTSAC
jgi:hypothetical protein